MSLKGRLLKICSRTLVIMATVPALLLGTTLAAVPVSASGQLQLDVDAIHAAGTAGVLAHVIKDGQSVKARAGEAKLDSGQPVPFDAQFRTGSNTKTIVAATVLQLVGEGKLKLEDSVEKWLPGEIQGNGYDGNKITIRQLLQHTSGVFDYTSDPEFSATLSTREDFMANRYHRYTPDDLIDIALSHPPTFEPGAGWSYSNTGYVIIGKVIKAVTGNSWDKEVKKRIIVPLGLTGTRAPGHDPTIAWPRMNGYHIFTTDDPTTEPVEREYTDTTQHDMSWGDAAGELITTTKDENRFITALLSGKVLKPAMLAEMKKTVEIVPGAGYGLGLLHQTVGTSCNAEFWGHTGGVVGYGTYVLASPDAKRSVVVALSTTTFTDAQYANDSGIATGQLLDHVFCGTGTNSTTEDLHGASPGATTLPGAPWATNPLR